MSGAPARPRSPARAGDSIADVDTPALLLDLDAFQANLAAVHRRVEQAGLALRPHGKAHKCPEIARRQLAAGAVGLCVQKIAEAEVFVAAGVPDVLVSNEVIGERKADRVAQLARRARVAVCVDHALQVAQLAAAARRREATIDVLIELDVGQGRCGVLTPAQAVALAQAIAGHAPALRLRGLQAYHGRAQHLRAPEERAATIETSARRAREARDALRAGGYACEVITGGGTGTYVNELASGVWTEVQPGSYVLMDADYARNAPDARAPTLAQALYGLCSVISARPGHAVLDGGLKTFAVDSGPPVPMAIGWGVANVSDEHTVLTAHAADAEPLAVGDRLRLVPGHCDPTMNLHDWLVVTRGDRVEDVWPIAARGAST